MAQQIWARADDRQQAHHQFFADRIDRRIGDLGKVLLEIIIQQARPVRQDGNRRIGAHRPNRIIALNRHRLQETADVFLGIAERLLCLQQCWRVLIFVLRQFGEFRLNHFQIVKLILRLFKPFVIRLCIGEVSLQLLVLDDPALLQIDQQHLAGLQAPFAGDVFLGKGQNAAF